MEFHSNPLQDLRHDLSKGNLQPFTPEPLGMKQSTSVQPPGLFEFLI